MPDGAALHPGAGAARARQLPAPQPDGHAVPRRPRGARASTSSSAATSSSTSPTRRSTGWWRRWPSGWRRRARWCCPRRSRCCARRRSLRTVRCEQAFFYARAARRRPRRDRHRRGRSARAGAGERGALGCRRVAPARRQPGSAGAAPAGAGGFGARRRSRMEDLPYAEADAPLRSWCSSGPPGGEASLADGAEALRRCLSLDPDLAAGALPAGDAAGAAGRAGRGRREYRRALRSLEEGRARATPFFLNHARLQVACAQAIERMETGAAALKARWPTGRARRTGRAEGFARKMRPPMRRLALLALLAALSGCFYPADRGRALEAKVDKLERRQQPSCRRS